MLSTLLAAAALAALTAPPAKSMVHARTPSAFLTEMTARGYQVEPVQMSGGIPVAIVRKDDMATVVAFGGCEEARNCTYVVLAANWEDLVSIPDSWLDQFNADYDLVQLRAVDGNLAVQMSVVLGRAGIPGSTFDFVLEQWDEGNAAAVREADEAGLIAPAPKPGS